MEIQCNGKHPKISVYLNEFDLKSLQKQIGEDYDQLNCKINQLHLSPISSKIPMQNQKVAQPQKKIIENDKNLKVNK